MLCFRPHLCFSACMLAFLACGCGDGNGTLNSAADQNRSDGSAASTNFEADSDDIPSPDREVPDREVPEGKQLPSGNPVNSSGTARITAAIPGPSGTELPNSNGPASQNSTQNDSTENGQSENEAVAILKEIQRLRVTSVPSDIEQARKARRERNDRIVEMATNVLRLTMNDSAQDAQFHQAIGQLLEARFQNALAGGQDDVEQLYMDVQALNERDPKSTAAAEGVYYIARFAHTKAGLLGRSQPEWLTTLSKWAREFADRFPDQQQRAVSMLFGAALSCELHASTAEDPELQKRLQTESRLCYSALAEGFADTTQGQKATGILRRMALVGQPLSQFSGPTLDGGFVSVEEFHGKPALIYFWASDDKEFVDQWQPLLQTIRSQIPADRLKIVGVALDEIETEMEAFMELHPLPGQQIFFPNPEQRSWNSPLVRFWGITQSPTVWLVNADGIVVSTSVSSTELVQLLQNVLKRQ